MSIQVCKPVLTYLTALTLVCLPYTPFILRFSTEIVIIEFVLPFSITLFSYSVFKVHLLKFEV
jgi:hypothetical protein